MSWRKRTERNRWRKARWRTMPKSRKIAALMDYARSQMRPTPSDDALRTAINDAMDLLR